MERAETLERDPAVTQPRISTSRLLAWNALAGVLVMSVWFGVASMMALLARKRFGAGDWQTLLVTAAVPTLLSFSIFWNELLQRMSIRRYLLLHWACTMLPLALGALAQNFWMLLGAFAVSAAGSAGWSPVSGEALRRFYPDAVRGRAFGVINAVTFLGMTAASFTIGRALDLHEDVFRLYLPLAAILHGAGILVLRRLVRLAGAEASRPIAERPGGANALRQLVAPIANMGQVLRADRVFYRYEGAFMTYGMGWMICNALLPILATDRLHMSYTQFAASTQVIYPLCLLVMVYPMGRLIDRIGPTQVSAISFGGLAIYPLMLMAAGSITMVGAATVVYGITMAGVHMAWMLGPVTLAPSPEKASQYVAIHATLVGLRGVLAQGLGMFIYDISGDFVWPFVLAALSFAWASWQMGRLRAVMRDRSLAARAAPPA